MYIQARYALYADIHTKTHLTASWICAHRIAKNARSYRPIYEDHISEEIHTRTHTHTRNKCCSISYEVEAVIFVATYMQLHCIVRGTLCWIHWMASHNHAFQSILSKRVYQFSTCYPNLFFLLHRLNEWEAPSDCSYKIERTKRKPHKNSETYEKKEKKKTPIHTLARTHIRRNKNAPKPNLLRW